MIEEKVSLPEQANISQVEALHVKLDEVLRSGHTVVMDARDVKRVDSAVLQLLYSFVKAVNGAGAGITWLGVSEEFMSSVRLLGLEDKLALY